MIVIIQKKLFPVKFKTEDGKSSFAPAMSIAQIKKNGFFSETRFFSKNPFVS
jgi:hypothetical protein